MEHVPINDSGHPILNLALLGFAGVTGYLGMNIEVITMEDLQYWDLLSALILKWVSIVSFLLLVVLNANKVWIMIKSIWTKEKLKL